MPTVSPDETLARLTLLLTPGLGNVRVGRLIATAGSATEVLDADPAQLAAWAADIRGLRPDRAADLHGALAGTRDRGDADAEREAAERSGTALIALGDPAYPAALRLIPDPPQMLWVRGKLEPADAVALGVVGSRRASVYGRTQAARLAGDAAAAGLTIVSGGARGIDAAAHRAVLQAARLGGRARTVAVIGSGLDRPYPAEHAELFRDIADRCGAVLSEYPLAVGPRAGHFPARNRIISGLSLGVLVIEAALRSGALITARLAVEEHGRECMALPGPADSPVSAGCHELIRKGGAAIVTGIADILDQLGEPGRALLGAVQPGVQPSPGSDKQTVSNATPTRTPSADWPAPQQALFEAAATPADFDTLLARTGLAADAAHRHLTRLELGGHLRREAGTYRQA